MAQEMKRINVFSYEVTSRDLDEPNIRILEELQREPRLTVSEPGRRIGMSSPGVVERVCGLEDTGVDSRLSSRYRSSCFVFAKSSLHPCSSGPRGSGQKWLSLHSKSPRSLSATALQEKTALS